MMYGIIAVALIFILANLPQYIRKQLTEKIADESSKAKENLQTSQLNFLTKIEWLRFFPLKKNFTRSNLAFLPILCCKRSLYDY